MEMYYKFLSYVTLDKNCKSWSSDKGFLLSRCGKLSLVVFVSVCKKFIGELVDWLAMQISYYVHLFMYITGNNIMPAAKTYIHYILQKF